MNPQTAFPCSLRLLRPALTYLLAVLLFSSASAQTDTGRITGLVTNSSGSAYLEGATVMIDGTNRSTTTDRRGEFDFGAMAPGDYSLRIAYTGMTAAIARVVVTAGQSASVTTALSEDVITMGTFSVVTNRNADALAVTEQRNAPNVKNVVDIASYGMLNNDNPAELLQLLPGVMGSIAFNEVDRVSIRGVDASFNSIQLDGNSFATPSINDGAAANSRSSVLSTTNTNNIKTAEVIKAITPDRPADAIGGIVNLIQRTALDYPKSAGRFEYRAGGQYVTTRSGYENRLTPNLQLTYHDVFGANRNWGVYATAGFNKESTNQFRTTQNVAAANNVTFGNVPNNNSTIENDRFRDRKNWALTIDHRPSFGHEFVFKYRHEDWLEATENLSTTFQTGTPAANWTPTVRALNLSSLVVNHGKNNPDVENNALSFDGKHRGDRWQLDYTAFYSSSIYKLYMDREEDLGSVFTTILPAFRPNIVVDSTKDALFPTVTITTANPDAVYNPDNYSMNLYQRQRPFSMNERSGGRADFKREFATAVPFFVKTGVARTVQYKRQDGANNQRIFVGEDGVAGINPATGVSDDRLSRFVIQPALLTGNDDAGNRRPFSLDIPTINRSFRDQPRLWTVDPYGEFQRALQNDYSATETIDAAYLMGETSWHKLRVLGGVRWEETKVKGTGLLRDQATATAAQVPDPYQRALINFGRPVTRTGNYRNFFPSVHTTYNIRPNLQARASYSTGIARPGYNNLIPTTTIDDANDSIVANSPGLKPQTADSYDLSLEYFSEPAGIISIGLFRKDIRDYITTTLSTVEPGNPFGEQYVGYQLRSPINAGSAKVQGVEFNVVQQLNFIPRPVGLFTLKGNLTLLRSEGNFGGTTRLASGEVPNFIPRAWNIVTEYTKGKFFMLARYNYQAGYLVGANANPNLATRNPDRNKLDVNFTYRWRREAHFFLAIDNVTEKPVYQQIGSGDRLFTGQVWAASRRFNIGVQGKF